MALKVQMKQPEIQSLLARMVFTLTQRMIHRDTTRSDFETGLVVEPCARH